ncbi:hypothetical protein Tco_1248708 [Tanacetum coccineum]
MSKVLQERGFRSLPSSTKMNPRDQVKSISTTIEVDSHPIRRIGSPQYAVSTGQNRCQNDKTENENEKSVKEKTNQSQKSKIQSQPKSIPTNSKSKASPFKQEPDETLYQAWERFKELFMKCPQHYLTEMQEVILFYNGLDVPTRLILDSTGVVPTKTVADAKKAIQEIVEYSQK